MFTIVNADAKDFAAKLLWQAAKAGRVSDVDFLQRLLLIGTEHVFRKGQRKLKVGILCQSRRLFSRITGKSGQKVYFWAPGYEFCYILTRLIGEFLS